MASRNQDLRKVARRLKERYRDFSHFNRRNPLDELIFILLSQMTQEAVYRRVFKQFKKSFPRALVLKAASVSQIRKSINGSGLEQQKAEAIHTVVESVNVLFGRPTLAPLKSMADDVCERLLTSLPKVGKKTARCVMMYSLDRQVFPVDVHCWRVSRRLGLICSENPHPTSRQMDELQDLIPRDLRYSLHVNIVSLGRDVCNARVPDCESCVLNDMCEYATRHNLKHCLPDEIGIGA